MDRKPAIMSKANMVYATERAAARIAQTLEDAKNLGEDSDREARLKRQVCRACHYFRRMGGAAMTSQPCMCCGQDQMYGSTATDVLCKPCATDGKLCKQCGGDSETRTQRRIWPEASPALEQAPSSGDVE